MHDEDDDDGNECLSPHSAKMRRLRERMRQTRRHVSEVRVLESLKEDVSPNFLIGLLQHRKKRLASQQQVGV